MAASISPGPPPVITVKHREAQAAQSLPELASQHVIRVIFTSYASRPEDGHARSDEVERTEPGDEILYGVKNEPQLADPRVRAFEHDAIFWLGLRRDLDGRLLCLRR